MTLFETCTAIKMQSMLVYVHTYMHLTCTRGQIYTHSAHTHSYKHIYIHTHGVSYTEIDKYLSILIITGERGHTRFDFHTDVLKGCPYNTKKC